MVWIVGIFAAIAAIWGFIYIPGFRNAVLVLALLVGGGIYWLLNAEQKKQVRARNIIQTSEVLLSDLLLSEAYAGSWRVSGKAKNSSAYGTEYLTLTVTVFDCPDSDPAGDLAATCEIIGQDDASAYVSIPPGQTRAFSAHASFTNMPTPRHLRWQYRFKGVVAQ